MEKNSLLDTSNKPGPGPIFGIVIIIIILLIGAVVVFSKQFKESKELQELYKMDSIIENSNSTINGTTQSTSTNIADIEKDLEESDLDNLEDIIDAIDTDIK